MANQSQIINAFVEKLIEEKGFEDLDPEVRQQMKSDLLDRAENRINAAILENMPKEKLAEFNELLNGLNNGEEVQSFCRDNIKNLDEVIAQTLMDFRSAYLNA